MKYYTINYWIFTLGGFNLTPNAIATCLKKIKSKSVPTLILGGGGYNKV